jgi:alpha-glucosidase (family GH31 glycosyl hydrolase)
MSLFEQLCYENMVSKWGESNFYNFARSAVDRSRSRTAVWNGDSHSNFTGLAYSVASGIRAGLIGFSQWAVDCGGYIRGANDPEEELWARWMHFSTFSPTYEIMIGTNHTPWYPPYTSRLVSVLKQTANLHASLLPYIKSYTYHATQTGVPIIRALFLEYPHDPKVYTTTDSYAFGEEFLVAPIVTEGGTRDVYFPSGSSYLEYINKTDVYQGGTTHPVSLEWEYVPVYVREGAIIPTGDIYQGNQRWTKWEPYLEIQAFPSYNVPASQFEYYNAVQNGTATITMVTDKREKSVIITYEDLGTPGTIIVYGKDGQRNATLTAGRGSVLFRGFVSLFGES